MTPGTGKYSPGTKSTEPAPKTAFRGKLLPAETAPQHGPQNLTAGGASRPRPTPWAFASTRPEVPATTRRAIPERASLFVAEYLNKEIVHGRVMPRYSREGSGAGDYVHRHRPFLFCVHQIQWRRFAPTRAEGCLGKTAPLTGRGANLHARTGSVSSVTAVDVEDMAGDE
jgi:hypothetical protein